MDAIAWIRPRDCSTLLTTPGLDEVLASAAAIESGFK